MNTFGRLILSMVLFCWATSGYCQLKVLKGEVNQFSKEILLELFNGEIPKDLKKLNQQYAEACKGAIEKYHLPPEISSFREIQEAIQSEIKPKAKETEVSTKFFRRWFGKISEWESIGAHLLLCNKLKETWKWDTESPDLPSFRDGDDPDLNSDSNFSSETQGTCLQCDYDSNLIKFRKCNHPPNLCKICVGRDLSAQVRDGSVFKAKCRVIGCNAKPNIEEMKMGIPLRTLSDLCLKEMEKASSDACFKFCSGEKDENPDSANTRKRGKKKRAFFKCERCNLFFSAKIQSGSGYPVVTCPKCKNEFCVNCFSKHPDKSCKEYREENDRLGEEVDKQLIAKKVIQRCGKCKEFYTRINACSNVVCKCGYQNTYEGNFREVTNGGLPAVLDAIKVKSENERKPKPKHRHKRKRGDGYFTPRGETE